MKKTLNIEAKMFIAVFLSASISFAQSSGQIKQKSTKKYAANTNSTVVVPAGVGSASSSSKSNSTAAPAGTSTLTIQDQVENQDKNFGLILGMEMAESIAKDESTPKENTLSVVINPSYKINSLLRLSANLGFYKENFGQHETKASNGSVSLSTRRFVLDENFSTSHSIAGIIPMAKETIERDRLKTGISLSNGIRYANDYFTIGYTLLIGQNFHDYTHNADGSANIERRLNQSVSVTVPVIDSLYLTTAGIYRIGWTYGGFNRYSFGFDADVNYDFTPNFSGNIGTSNEGPALKANGTDSNISLYDENSSVFRMGISYVY